MDKLLCLFVVLTLISCSQPTENLGGDDMGFSSRTSGTTAIAVGADGTMLVSTDYAALDTTTPVGGYLRYFFDREHQVADWPSK